MVRMMAEHLCVGALDQMLAKQPVILKIRGEVQTQPAVRFVDTWAKKRFGRPGLGSQFYHSQPL